MLVFRNGTANWLDSYTNVLDKDGNPQRAEGLYSEAVCYITTLEENKKGMYDDGRYRNCSYSVMFDMDSVSYDFNPKSVSLHHENKGFLGDFTVQRIEYYNLTRSIEIWV